MQVVDHRLKVTACRATRNLEPETCNLRPERVSALIQSNVQQIRDRLIDGREAIRARHAAGASGDEVASALTALADEAVSQLVLAAVEKLQPSEIAQFETGMAIVGLGSYGRGELAPFSDIDLLLLHQPEAASTAERLVTRLVRDVWDAGLALGSSLRTLPECIRLARRDLSVHTALLESRHLHGNSGLTAVLWEEVRRLTRGGRADAFLAGVLEKRTAEGRQFGASAYLLEPNLKKSKGGLRDLNLLGWAARARYRVDRVDRLEQVGLLSPDDAEALDRGRDLLLRARHELHFHAGRAQDVLTFEEQERLAGVFGYRDRPGMLGVEQFMQTYYRHASKIDEIAERFVRRTRRRPKWHGVLRPMLTQRVEGAFLLGGGEVSVQESARARVLATLEGKLRPFSLAVQGRLRVADDLLDQLRASTRISADELSGGRQRLLDILSYSGNLAVVLRQLRAVGLLELIVPEFAHARGLVQFNQFHKYTVDEHTILCLASADELLENHGPVGQAYRDIRHREILHLALLLHDLGKGFEEDHRERGRQIAVDNAERFGLPATLAEMLVFLVHRHTLMSQLAFRRDTSDPKLVADFARAVHTPELLRMLYVMTVCDIKAVGPETWTSWKGDVLADFYARTMEKLSGQPPTLDPDTAVERIRAEVKQHIADTLPADWLERHVSSMPAAYLLTSRVGEVVEHLKQLATLSAGDVLVTTRYHRPTHTVDYTIFTSDDVARGVLAKIAGVFAAKGLNVLGAQISTHRDGVVVDRFEVVDGDHRAEPPAQRTNDVVESIRRALLGKQTVREMLRAHRRIRRRPGSLSASRLPTQVDVDNDTSDRFTILDVFAADRPGLLYTIAHTLAELGLSVGLAKIDTSLDQALDVFYVTDLEGQKINDDSRLHEIRRRLLEVIEAFELTGEMPED